MDSSEKRKIIEPALDISKKQKKSASNENDNEKTNICEYCHYRKRPSQKEPSERMCYIKLFKAELKNYVTKHITVHSCPDLGPGLLKEDSKICNPCYQVIIKKFNAYERGAEFTPGKKKKQIIKIGAQHKEPINYCPICKQIVSIYDNNKKFREVRQLTESILKELEYADIRPECSLGMIHLVCLCEIRLLNMHKGRKKYFREH